MIPWKKADIIRIDWAIAIKEAENAFERLNNLEMAQVLCKIKLAYNKDDTFEYLDILDKYRKELKYNDKK